MSAPTEFQELSRERTDADDADGWRYTLHVPVALAAFGDHFPGHPIVPAFVQLAQVVRYCQREWPDLQPWSGGPACKFKAPIAPGAQLQLQLTRSRGETRVKFLLSEQGSACASGTLTFGTPPGH